MAHCRVRNVRELPGYAERRPIIPAGGIYIGHKNWRYRLSESKWANPFVPKKDADREPFIAAYEHWFRSHPQLMSALHELCGFDLYCWCAPKACHGDVLLRLLHERYQR
jgi:hypothetical protein